MTSTTKKKARKKKAQTKKAKPQYHHGDLRRALMDAAVELVRKEQLATISLRNVAEQAGVTSAAPYHHFADKLALWKAIAEDGFELLTARLATAVSVSEAHPRVEQRLAAVMSAYLDFAVEHAPHYRVMFLPELKELPDIHARALAALGLWILLLREARPDLSELDAQVLGVSTWALGHGFAVLTIDNLIVEKEEFPPHATLRAGAVRHVVDLVKAARGSS